MTYTSATDTDTESIHHWTGLVTLYCIKLHTNADTPVPFSFHVKLRVWLPQGVAQIAAEPGSHPHTNVQEFANPGFGEKLPTERA